MALIEVGLIQTDETNLGNIKAHLRNRVDGDAECQRLRYITGGATKAMEYIEAKDQALAVQQMGEAAASALADSGAAQYPVLAASVPLEAPTLWAAAQLIISRYEAYMTIGGRIKRAAVEAKKAIADAPDAAAAKAAYEAVQWPS